MWESWIVLGIFVVNLVFMLIMSFTSPYFKHIMSLGIGKIFNIVWVCVIIASAGVLMFYNMQCTLGSSKGATKALGELVADNSCKYLAISIVVFLALITVLNMSWGIYNTLEYKNANTTNATNTPVKQEGRH